MDVPVRSIKFHDLFNKDICYAMYDISCIVRQSAFNRRITEGSYVPCRAVKVCKGERASGVEEKKLGSPTDSNTPSYRNYLQDVIYREMNFFNRER